MKKQQWFNYVYWSIAGFVMWIVLFSLSRFNAKLSLQDSLTISSAILLGVTLLSLLLKYGWLERSVVKYRNSKFNITSEKPDKKKLDLNEYQKVLKKRKSWPIWVNVAIYAVLLITAFLI